MNLIIYLLCFSLSFSLLFFILYRIQTNQLNDSFQKKILKLNDEIQKEKNLLQQTEKEVLKLPELEESTKSKLLKIKLEISSIDFTLKEICKFI